MPDPPTTPDPPDRHPQRTKTSTAERSRRRPASPPSDASWDHEWVGFALGLMAFVVVVVALAACFGVFPSDSSRFGRHLSEDSLILLVLGGGMAVAVYGVIAAIGAAVLHALKWPRTARGVGLSALVAVAIPLVGCGGCLLWLGSNF